MHMQGRSSVHRHPRRHTTGQTAQSEWVQCTSARGRFIVVFPFLRLLLAPLLIPPAGVGASILLSARTREGDTTLECSAGAVVRSKEEYSRVLTQMVERGREDGAKRRQMQRYK
uniref:Uncharacterized protein n=1 Tax=Palpitomonas bilix TaxID=652834 RepID=A0A7S3G1R0_9EUKA|mmetsp:Transcript_21663/g.56230  ORF Transcript_21663/g.56230 Transcript_21663/m.56230 type:complete len:114 (+) Transcript_21663:408-749(+)